MSLRCLIVIAILRMLVLVLIALVQLAQTSGACATSGRGRRLLQLESIADRAGSCMWRGRIQVEVRMETRCMIQER